MHNVLLDYSFLQHCYFDLACTVHAIIDAHMVITVSLLLLIIVLSIPYQFVVTRTPSLINSLKNAEYIH